MTPETAYREFRTALHRYLLRRIDDPQDVDDVLQNVFLRVTRHEDALAQAREPLAWLYTVAKSALIDHQRRGSKHANVAAQGAFDDIADPGGNGEPSDDFAQCLMPLVAKLPAPYREAIVFVDMEGGQQTELAAAKGLEFSTAKSRVQRGRKRLKAAILACCQIERDALRRVTDLDPGACDPTCC